MQILRLPAVLSLVGLSRSTLYEEIAAGRFPRQVRLTKRSVGWRSEEVAKWLADRVSQ
jgi:prophage regulatory protein